jgi:hypothetical protein
MRPAAWTFDCGERRPASDELCDIINAADFDTAIAAAGYIMVAGGHPESLVTAYEAWRSTPISDAWQYLLDVCFDLGGRPNFIFVRDAISRLQLEPHLHASTIACTLNDLALTGTMFFEKAFHALHGHYLSDCCPQCDPDAHKRLKKMERNLKQQQASRQQRQHEPPEHGDGRPQGKPNDAE